MEGKEAEKTSVKAETKLNRWGKRIVVNWCAYSQRLIKKKREEEKKEIVVSKITAGDRLKFREAYRKLLKLRAQNINASQKVLKRLKLSRSVRSITREKSPVKVQDNYVACPLVIKKPKSKLKILDKTGPKIAPAKRKPNIFYKLKPKKAKLVTFVAVDEQAEAKPETPIKPLKYVPPIPPLRRVPWVPLPRTKPRIRPVIMYPEVKRVPWQPPVKAEKPKTPLVRLSRTFYPLPVPSLDTTWHNFKFITPSSQILMANLSQCSKRFNFRSNGKQSAFIAIVALVNTKSSPMKLWSSKDLDEIICYGDLNYRKALSKFRCHQTLIKPPEIKFKIYTSRAKVLTEIGASSVKGTFNPDDTKELVNHIDEMFNHFECLIFTYCDQSFAIWKEFKAFYVFNSEDCNATGKRVARGQGAGCVIRSPVSSQKIVEYLLGCLKVPKKCYEIYSMRINQKITIEDEIRKLMSKQSDKLMKEEKVAEVKAEEAPKKLPETPKQVEVKPLVTGLAAIKFDQQPDLELSDKFIKPMTPFTPPSLCGYLKCSDYLTSSRDDVRKSPFVCAMAIAMLKLCKSSLWRPSTLDGIIKSGREIFQLNVVDVLREREEHQIEVLDIVARDAEADKRNAIAKLKREAEKEDANNKKKSKKKEVENVKKKKMNSDDEEEEKPKKVKKVFVPQPEPFEKHSDIPVTEIHPVVSLKSRKLQIHSENVIFGKIKKREHDDMSLEDGVSLFFKSFDCGLIQGPEVVAVWREKNFFFMFDPNQCNEYKRSAEGELNSALTCFRSLKDLLELYTGNIQKEFRDSIFKLTQVEIVEHQPKANDWQNFKAIGMDKWILRGTSVEVIDEAKSVATCIVALAKTREKGIQSWSSSTVDEIFNIGDDFHFASLATLQEDEISANRSLKPSQVGRELKLENVVVDVEIDEAVIIGTLSDAGKTLLESLKKFFDEDDLGLVSIGESTAATWKHQEHFYLFNYQKRDENGRNAESCNSANVPCVMRFTSIDRLCFHLMANVTSSLDSPFTISRVNVTARSSIAPCLYHYEKFGDDKSAAILRAFDNIHEDSEAFRSSRLDKTLCSLIACMCFAKVMNPHHWHHSDVNEVLKIGNKLLCRLTGSTTDEDQETFWKQFETIEVGAVKMAVKPINNTSGTFSGRKTLLPTAVSSKEVVEDDFKISEIKIETSLGSITEDAQSISSTTSVEEVVSLHSVMDSAMGSQREVFAVLRSKLFNVAVFKMNHVYFLFDPKASDANGRLVTERLEEFLRNSMAEQSEKIKVKGEARPTLEEEFELIFGRRVVFVAPSARPAMGRLTAQINDDLSPFEISHKGSAYIAWFSSLNLLVDHILSKVPPLFKNETFTVTFLSVSKEIPQKEALQPWHNFEAISSSHWILRGSMSQNDNQFSALNRNNQDISNCVMALAFATICNSSTDWKAEVVDVILKLGDRLYKKSLAKWLKLQKAPGNMRLNLSQLDFPVFIRPFVISLNDELVKKDLLVKSQDEEMAQTLKKALLDFCSSSNEFPLAIMSSKDYHVALWKADDGAFMMFDPHDIGPDGVRRFTGFACIQRFSDHKTLVDIFCNNIKDLEGFNEFELTKISIVKNYFNETNDGGDHRRFESGEDFTTSVGYNLFTTTNNIRSIRAKNEKTIEWTKENVPLGICYAIAALSVSQSLDSEYFTRDVIDKILLFGNDLIKECSNICFTDFNLCNQALCPDEINWNFELNSVHTNIQMDIFQRGIISSHPCPAPNLMQAVEEFFNFHSIGVLTTSSFVVAIWQEAGNFYVFHAQPVNELGEIIRTSAAFPGLIVFESFDDLYQNIISNIDEASYCEPFELRICNITMTDLCRKICESPCHARVEDFFNEEIVGPAVAAQDVTTGDEQVTKQTRRELPADVIERITQSKSNAPGLIKTSTGGLICGRLSKNSKSFNETARKFHAGAICLVAVAMSSLKDFDCWSSETIDSVIKSGNSLYIESSVAHNMKELTLSMLNTSLSFCGCQVNLKIEPLREIAPQRESLLSTLCELFSCFANGYLCRGLECWALFKRGKAFYVFDPVGIKVKEKKMLKRRAVLMRFEELDAMVDELLGDDSEEVCKIGGILSCSNDC